MKMVLMMISAAWMIPTAVKGQTVESVLLLDTRTGYTSNMLLNPLVSEWERTEHAAYMSVLPMGQISLFAGRFSADASGGFVYSPFLNRDETWTGAFGFLAGRVGLGDQLSIGAEGGYSTFSTSQKRNFRWIQPVLTWSPAYNTQIRLKAGPFYRESEFSDPESESVTEQFSLYSLDAEYWPDFKWQLRGSLTGNLEAPADNIGFRASAGYAIARSLRLTVSGGVDRFGYQVIQQSDGTGGGGGFPPIGNPGGGEEIVDEADYLVRAGAEASYTVFRNTEISLRVDLLRYNSTAGTESLNDLQVSAGVRYSFSPTVRSRGEAGVEWRQNERQTVILNIRYSGEGGLYLIGDFNDWQEPGIPLSQAGRNRFVAQTELSAGAYEYKILLIEDGEESWIELSDDTYTVPDGFGGVNGLIFID